jgi:hypothetical protein
MKKVIIILMAFFLFNACKKDKTDELSIKGKWDLINLVANTYENNILTDTETESGSGTTYNFQGNGIVIVADVDNGTESFPYSIESDSQIRMDGQLIDIKNLTSNTVTLSFRDVFSPTIYTEVIVNLQR